MVSNFRNAFSIRSAILRLLRRRSILLFALLPFFLSSISLSQTRLLDDFETLQGWKPIVSDGAKLNITSGPGNPGNRGHGHK